MKSLEINDNLKLSYFDYQLALEYLMVPEYDPKNLYLSPAEIESYIKIMKHPFSHGGYIQDIEGIKLTAAGQTRAKELINSQIEPKLKENDFEKINEKEVKTEINERYIESEVVEIAQTYIDYNEVQTENDLDEIDNVLTEMTKSISDGINNLLKVSSNDNLEKINELIEFIEDDYKYLISNIDSKSITRHIKDSKKYIIKKIKVLKNRINNNKFEIIINENKTNFMSKLTSQIEDSQFKRNRKFGKVAKDIIQHNEISIITMMFDLFNRIDPYTAGHQLNVAALVKEISKIVVDNKDKTAWQNKIYKYTLSALIHDLGKFTLPLSILSKPGKLSIEERALLNSHVDIGTAIMKEKNFSFIENFEEVSGIIAQHHLRLNDTGYPREEDQKITIKEGGKILAIADVYEAITTARPYRNEKSFNDAFKALREKEEVVKKKANKNSKSLKETKTVQYLFDQKIVNVCKEIVRPTNKNKWEFPVKLEDNKDFKYFEKKNKRNYSNIR